ncbi:thioredoxin family protein [Arcticibacterium luteifluviistationis]|uniref:Thioredoxin domain-containing protein n=1 Tax=Arcticibacterium luteifluviistationis TaxID=1784714 RepID=A0A2Z4GHC7_9BACT|nr:thioredoxin domain-containing protein [Arcticibacterium luteifluviistationis]AWW00721.1 hypothetical protein DJ013_22035 [Arcticibacterium luteifluviistationis]
MTKRLTLVAFLPLFLVFSSLTFLNSGIDFKLGETYSFESIKEDAVSLDKIIFVDLFATWCGPCKKMEAEVFNKEKVGQKYNESFINYKVDIQSPEGSKLARLYNINAYPTYLFLKPNGEVLYRLEGVFTTDGMIEEADFALGLE